MTGVPRRCSWREAARATTPPGGGGADCGRSSCRIPLSEGKGYVVWITHRAADRLRRKERRITPSPLNGMLANPSTPSLRGKLVTISLLLCLAYHALAQEKAATSIKPVLNGIDVLERDNFAPLN